MIVQRPFLILVLVSLVLLGTPALAAEPNNREVAALHSGIDLLEQKEYLKALDIFMPMALIGYSEAQYQIGWMYEYGTGIPQDSCIATVWFDKAARQNHTRALRSLAFSYMGGEGVRENHKLAYLLMLHAVKKGLSWAKKDLSFISIELTPVQKQEVERQSETWTIDKLLINDFIFIPEEAWRKRPGRYDYYRHEISPCKADFSGTGVDLYGPKVYRPDR